MAPAVGLSVHPRCPTGMPRLSLPRIVRSLAECRLRSSILIIDRPRWYIKKRRFQKAFQSLLILRKHPILAARDLYSINAQIEVERDIIGDTSFFKRFVELFTIPRVRRATLASWTVMIAQQMCGIVRMPDLLQ